MNCLTPDTTVPHVPAEASTQPLQTLKWTSRRTACSRVQRGDASSHPTDLFYLLQFFYSFLQRNERMASKKRIGEKRGTVVTVCVIRLAFIPALISTNTTTSHKESWRFVHCASLHFRHVAGALLHPQRKHYKQTVMFLMLQNRNSHSLPAS